MKTQHKLEAYKEGELLEKANKVPLAPTLPKEVNILQQVFNAYEGDEEHEEMEM